MFECFEVGFPWELEISESCSRHFRSLSPTASWARRSGVRLQGAGWWVDLVTPRRIYKKMIENDYSSGLWLFSHRLFSMFWFGVILWDPQKTPIQKKWPHLIISYIPFCMIVHQKSQQPNKTKKTTIERCSRRYYALTEYSSRGITPIFLTQPLPRAALWTMATSNQRLDQIWNW